VNALEPGRLAYAKVRSSNDELLAAQLVDWTSAELNLLAELMERLDSDLRSVEKRARPKSHSGTELKAVQHG
jgi:hypothetical protein